MSKYIDFIHRKAYYWLVRLHTGYLGGTSVERTEHLAQAGQVQLGADRDDHLLGGTRCHRSIGLHVSAISNLIAILVVVAIVVAAAFWVNNRYDAVPTDKNPRAIVVVGP